MDSLLKKLNLSTQQQALLLNVPAELADMIPAFSERIAISQQLDAIQQADFVMVFVQQLAQVDQLADWVAAHTEGDAVVWLVYPKQTSRQYRCDFNRDTGWASLGKAGFEPVRLVAVNADWSALRFRRASFIKKLTRAPESALSEEGKTKASRAVLSVS